MKVFTPNLDKFKSTFFIAPIDDYELEVIKVGGRTITYDDKDNPGKKITKPVFDVLFGIVNGQQTGTEYKGKPVSINFFVDVEKDDALNAPLALMQACMGIESSDTGDREFAQKIAGWDVGIDAETGTLGADWQKMVKTRVRSNLSSTIDKKDPTKQYQKFGKFRPF